MRMSSLCQYSPDRLTTLWNDVYVVWKYMIIFCWLPNMIFRKTSVFRVALLFCWVALHKFQVCFWSRGSSASSCAHWQSCLAFWERWQLTSRICCFRILQFRPLFDLLRLEFFLPWLLFLLEKRLIFWDFFEVRSYICYCEYFPGIFCFWREVLYLLLSLCSRL